MLIFVSYNNIYLYYTTSKIMGKTYRKIDTTIETRISFLPRSVSYKSDHSKYSRGGRRARDKAAHAGHRNQNKCIEDETQYVSFTHSEKKYRNVCKDKKYNPQKYNTLIDIVDSHGWTNGTSLEENLNKCILEDENNKEYINRCLKQLKRRGAIGNKYNMFDYKTNYLENMSTNQNTQ